MFNNFQWIYKVRLNIENKIIKILIKSFQIVDKQFFKLIIILNMNMHLEIVKAKVEQI